MLLVYFTCIGLKLPSIDNTDYVDNIKEQLVAAGFADKIEISSDEEEVFFQLEFSRTEQFKKENPEIIQIQFEFGTYQGGLQLAVTIHSDNQTLSPTIYYYENLKFEVKENLKKDWNRIEWLVDKDSECLAVALYPEIFKAENLIRQMIAELMVRRYGDTWWDKFVPIKVRDKHRQRFVGYKSTVPGFANIDERLLSIDIGDLLKIITVKINKWSPIYDETINRMLNELEPWKEDAVKKFLLKQMTPDTDLWTDIFSKYLDEDFKRAIHEFDLNRNHVAHNKLLDRQAYSVIIKNTSEVSTTITLALEKINKDEQSKEVKAIIQRQLDEEQAEWDAHYEELMESEAGVEIRNDDEILELLNDVLQELYIEIEDLLRFRSDIEIDFSDPEHIKFIYKITDDIKVLKAEIRTDSSQGAESSLTLSVKEDGFSTKLTYINGEIDFDEDQSYYVPLTEDEIPDIESAAQDILDYIDSVFPNLRSRVDRDKYRIIKDGGESPVLEIPCEECGEYYIASDNIYADAGTCLNCGAKHEICTCERCGTYFIEEMKKGEPALCENCLAAIEEE